ncbi:pathogenesis-related genes transcriptional activator PTI6-like [Asparagus officinalis]|uniref:pathogenesis-related genes transcriptional activator PTI6-like n=1 Tax=Asparagus officinalis TaxID=4686 RepID=UPI00098E6975|nr:pathogenesis-related genes transcriptional activator PTI6-like [Asparagus officinalis]
MARKRKNTEPEDSGMSSSASSVGHVGNEGVAAFGGIRRARKRFVGVRQRPSCRWVEEIKDTIQKIRVWIGTFDTAEELLEPTMRLLVFFVAPTLDKLLALLSIEALCNFCDTIQKLSMPETSRDLSPVNLYTPNQLC